MDVSYLARTTCSGKAAMVGLSAMIIGGLRSIYALRSYISEGFTQAKALTYPVVCARIDRHKRQSVYSEAQLSRVFVHPLYMHCQH